MATKLTPKVGKESNQIPRYLPKSEYKNYSTYSGIYDTEAKRYILQVSGDSGSACCGIHETYGFTFPTKNLKYSQEIQDAFNKFINDSVLDTDGSPSLRYLVLNREHGKTKANQPDWFIECLENYPGATTLDWMSNRNTDHSSDIKPYFLPVYA